VNRRFLIAPALVVLTVAGCAPRIEDRAPALIDSAVTALRRGDLAAADAFVKQGEALTRDQPESEWAWRFRFLRADVQLSRRESADAARTADAPLPSASPVLPELRARQQYLRARLEYSQGHLAKALEIADAALRDAPAGTELNLEIDGFAAQLGLQLGRWAESESRLDAVISSAAASGHHYVEGMALVSQGMGKFVRNRFDEALPPFERVAASASLEGTRIHARALYNSGMCYARLGEFDRAIAIQRRAVAALENHPDGSDYELALGQLGTTYLHQNNAAEGLEYLRRAFKAASDAKVGGDASLWAGNLAKAYIELGQWDDAERFNEEAKRLATANRGARVSYTLEHSAAIAAGRARFDDATRLYREVLASADAPPSVLWHAHHGLALIAVAQHQPARAAQEFEAALDVIEKTRSGLLRDDYKLAYLTELIDFYRVYVRVLDEQGNVDRALEIADSSRGRVLAESQRASAPPRMSLSSIRQLAAKTQTVFLSYWLTPAASTLWVVTADGVHEIALPPAKDIDALVADHQSAIGNALADPLASPQSAGDRLYQRLVVPAKKWLRSGSRVVIVPDGSLHGLNFETLPVDGPRRHYLIEDLEIQVAPSLASLTAAVQSRDAALSASTLIIGNPTPRPPEFPALKFARAEMSAVAGRFATDRVVAYEAERATPAAYREARPERFSYVHFAAHATANRDSPLDSAVILAGSDATYKLYARDVAALPLSADLVTVSACRSAGDRAYSGEGLVGFAWAFLRAGARRVVAGLWDVDDRSTAELMEQLYAGVAAGERPSAALRRAKLHLIAEGGGSAKPFAWAAFQLYTVVP
jgi:CHAT domain-containing protein